MKDENKRNLYLKVRVSQEEMDAINRKFKNSGMQTLSGFVRAMIFEGYIIQMDEMYFMRFINSPETSPVTLIKSLCE